MNVGFVGLGIMGSPMASNLLKGGSACDHSVMVRALEMMADLAIGQRADNAP